MYPHGQSGNRETFSLTDLPLDDLQANAVMAAAHNAWSAEMIHAIQADLVIDGDDPTKVIEAVIDNDGIEYVATLTYSVRKT